MWPPSLQTFFVAFTMVWTYLVQKGSRCVRSIFQKSTKTEVKTFQLIKIEKRQLLYLILAAQGLHFYHDFYNDLDIFIPKIKKLSQR